MAPNSETLAHRHVRLGWSFVLVFLTLGTALEMLQGLKFGFYLDVANETRRHMWTLAHAHGTLFGLLHLAFAASVRRYASDASVDRWARLSVAASIATALIPVGFFAGGFGFAGGDPGVGVLVVPFGALLLLGTIAGVLWMCRRQPAVLVGCLGFVLLGCGEERPPQAGDVPPPLAESATASVVFLDAEADQFVLTYAGDRGEFADCKTVREVPEPARGLVGVNLLTRRAPTGKVWVTNLLAPASDGRYPLETVPREQFEEIVLGSVRSSEFELPEGLELPDVEPARDGPVILYKTSWCGVCKQAEAYLKRKGVEYVAKDIEKDREAAAEMAAKAKQAGIPTGSVPMIDVGGELLRGFDRARLEQLL